MTTTSTIDAVADFRETGYFPALDGIRAISVLMVMSNHLHSGSAIMRRTPGWAGVDTFCVLSGFLITTLLMREQQKVGTVRLRAFYLRRFFRIVPIFLLVLLLYVPVAYFGEHGLRWQAFKSALPLYLTFMQEFVPHEAPFSFSWTLGIEEKFYLIWPILAFILLKRPRTRIALAAILSFIFGVIYILLESSSDRAFYQARSYGALALGSLLACCLASRIALPLSRSLKSLPSVLPVLFILLSFGLVDYDRKFILLFDFAIAILISHILLVPSFVRNWLSSSLPVWIGKRSYSMYLIHLLVLNPIRVLIHPKTVGMEFLVLMIAYLLTAGCAHLLYLLVEQPMRRIGTSLTATRSSSSKPSVAILHSAR